MTDGNASQFVIYQSEDGQIRLDVRFVDETVWLSQTTIAELFGTTKQNVGQHLKNIFSEHELSEQTVVKDFFTTAADGIFADEELEENSVTEKSSVTAADGKNYLTIQADQQDAANLAALETKLKKRPKK